MFIMQYLINVHIRCACSRVVEVKDVLIIHSCAQISLGFDDLSISVIFATLNTFRCIL